MKLFTIMVTAFISLPLSAAADTTVPLIELTNHPGYVPDELSGYTTCSIFENRVRTVRQLGYGNTAVTMIDEKQIEFTGNIEGLLSATAAAELKSEDNFLCDGPSTTLTAHNPNGGDRLVIYSTGGCGSPTKSRQGFIGMKMMKIAEIYCPAIHRASGM